MGLQQLPTPTRVYLLCLAAFLGLVMGSSLNCLAWRLAHGEKWSGGRSACPACGHTLGVGDLVPLFSWLALRGRCRYCHAPISVRYPLTELLFGLCTVSLLLHFGLAWDTLVYAVLYGCLLCLSLVDLDVQIIPDRFLLIPAVLRLVQLAVQGGLSAVLSALWPAAVLGGAVLLLSLVLDKVLHRESMGGGDIKLLAMLGLFFSFPCCLLLVLLACLLGLLSAVLLAGKDTAFPFGPAISVAAWMTLLIGGPVVSWYLGLFV